ncbi:hypothetical protein P879_00156, partial [Paragonimus westermani]
RLLDFQEPGAIGNLPVHLCAIKGNLALFEFLIEMKVYMNRRNRDGFLPIHLIAKHDHVQLMQMGVLFTDLSYLLIKLGEVNTVRSQHILLIILLRHGANMYMPDDHQFYPILTAIENISYQCLQLLSDSEDKLQSPTRGSNPSLLDEMQSSKIINRESFALRRKFNRDIKPRFDGADLSIMCTEPCGHHITTQQPPFSWATWMLATLKFYHSTLSVCSRCHAGSRPLYAAARCGQLDTCKVLLKLSPALIDQSNFAGVSGPSPAVTKIMKLNNLRSPPENMMHSNFLESEQYNCPSVALFKTLLMVFGEYEHSRTTVSPMIESGAQMTGRCLLGVLAVCTQYLNEPAGKFYSTPVCLDVASDCYTCGHNFPSNAILQNIYSMTDHSTRIHPCEISAYHPALALLFMMQLSLSGRTQHGHQDKKLRAKLGFLCES